MDRRETLLSLIAVVAVAAIVRISAAATIPFPRPEDTAYYVGVARNLLEGRGLVSDALWSFGTPPLVFPRPAFEVWLPLPTFLAAIPMALGGTTFAAAQVSSVVAGSLVPALASWIARDVATERGLPANRVRMIALGAGLTAGVYLPLVLHSALPDSTMPFAVLGLLALMLMAALVRRPPERLLDVRLITLGVLLGLAALTRNEAIWLALTWVIVLVAANLSWRRRIELIAVVAVAALVVFAPWAARNWAVFGSPLPGQAATNALSLDGRDIFAWSDPPTLERYLAAGLPTLLSLRVTGVLHNLLNVLLFLGIPISAIGLVSLVGIWRGRVIRPLLVFSLLAFLATSLLFPVATTWGTFLHAAGPVHVLLIVSAIVGLDALIAWVGVRRGWTRPVAWLGPMLGVASCLLFSLFLVPSFGAGSRATQAHYEELGRRLEAAGHPIGPDAAPVISDFPIWVAETARVRSLALPEEPLDSVLDLATTFDAGLVVLSADGHGYWPPTGDTAAARCFTPLDLGPGPVDDPLAGTTVYVIRCPEGT